MIRRLRVKLCDNAARNNSGNGIGGVSQCYDNLADRVVTVFYDEYQEKSNSDTMNLCIQCSKELARSALSHGYSVKVGG